MFEILLRTEIFPYCFSCTLISNPGLSCISPIRLFETLLLPLWLYLTPCRRTWVRAIGRPVDVTKMMVGLDFWISPCQTYGLNPGLLVSFVSTTTKGQACRFLSLLSVCISSSCLSILSQNWYLLTLNSNTYTEM